MLVTAACAHAPARAASDDVPHLPLAASPQVLPVGGPDDGTRLAGQDVAAVPGDSYTATTWVRADTPAVVTMALGEGPGGRTLARYRIGVGWSRLGITRVAVGAHLSVTVRADRGAALRVDGPTVRHRRLDWSDGFDAPTLDRSVWAVLDHSTYGDGNGELACLMDRPENVQVTGGRLVLTARRERPALSCTPGDTRFPGGRSYSSGFVETRGRRSWTYGRFAVRAQTPTRQGVSRGLWPAFWLRPDDGGLGELDVFEAVGGGPGAATQSRRVRQSIHYDYLGTHPIETSTYDLPDGAPSDGLHDYVVEWDAARIDWYVDGALVFSRDPATTPWLAQAFGRPMFLRLNLAVGDPWNGAPDRATRLPARYEIDAVQVHGQPVP